MENKIEKPRCETCAFWTENEQQVGQPRAGDCRFNPPKIEMVPQRTFSGEQQLSFIPMVPQVAAQFWCGQHQPEEFWLGEEEDDGMTAAERFDRAALTAKIRAGHTPTLEEAQAYQVDPDKVGTSPQQGDEQA